jgi:enoyl-CoA hydratase/carnithine racemase
MLIGCGRPRRREACRQAALCTIRLPLSCAGAEQDDPMLDDAILIETDASGVAVVTLNRPAKRNAVALSMWQRLRGVITELDARDDVRAIVLTGAGGNFSAGADISEFPVLRSTLEDARIYEEAADAATRTLRDCRKPTIAAVHGFGIGGGCGLALACDLRVGDATTRMGIPAARRGVVYGALDSSLLLRQVGLARAKLVLFTGRMFPVQECLSMGLLDLVGEDALPVAIEHARAIAANAPLSVRGGKIVLELLAAGQGADRAAEITALTEGAAASADYREATAAFMEKRPARFRGR